MLKNNKIGSLIFSRYSAVAFGLTLLVLVSATARLSIWRENNGGFKGQNVNQKNFVFSSAHSGFSGDNIIRNCITSDVIGRWPASVRTVNFEANLLQTEAAGERQKSFQSVFDKKSWGTGFDKSEGLHASGGGSTLHYAQEVTAALHAAVNHIKQRHGLSRVRMLDVPCGDMSWMSRFLHSRDDVDYTGVDVVPDLIKHHNGKYNNTSTRFKHIDYVENKIDEKYDLILCRMLLQHLYTADAMKLLEHFSGSGSGILLTTSFYEDSRNVDLGTKLKASRFRHLNLELPPFALVPPLCVSRDGPFRYKGIKYDHYVGAWSLPLKRVERCDDVHKFKFGKTPAVDFFSCTNWQSD